RTLWCALASGVGYSLSEGAFAVGGVALPESGDGRQGTVGRSAGVQPGAQGGLPGSATAGSVSPADQFHGSPAGVVRGPETTGAGRPRGAAAGGWGVVGAVGPRACRRPAGSCGTPRGEARCQRLPAVTAAAGASAGAAAALRAARGERRGAGRS